MITRRILPLVAAALYLTTGERASADTITLAFASVSNANNVLYTSGVENFSGPYNYSVTSNPSNLNIGSTASLYCLQYDVNLPTNGKNPPGAGPPITYTVSPLNSLTGGSSVANLIEALYYSYNNNNITTNQEAFQLALWELVSDGTYDIGHPTASFFTTGSLTAPSNAGGFSSANPTMSSAAISAQLTATSLAQTWLSTLLNDTSTQITTLDTDLTNEGTLSALTGGMYNGQAVQNQLIFVPSVPVTGTPAPPGLILAGIGLVALIGRTRFNRRPVNA